MKPGIIRKAAHLSILVLLILGVSYKVDHQSKRPNILLIVSDDLGYSDLGCYGSEIRTPNIDRLAENGVRMSQFYSTGRCCPSRASILTGLYPHRAGLGYMVNDLGSPGYRGRLSDSTVTIAQALQSVGYRTFISGKWHLGTNDPTKYGFEEFYGTLASAQTYWDPDHYIRIPEENKSISYSKEEFYGTDALTDHAIDFINKARMTPDKPWFTYLAYNAPHFPLQAPKGDIDKYVEIYKAGWDKIREERYSRMKKLGIISDEVLLSPRSQYWDWGEEETGTNPAWDDLPADRQNDLVQRMAIYAAMVDRMDRNIGRLLQYLEKNRELDNTLIIFISDNGACAEWDPFGFDVRTGPLNILHTSEQLETMGSSGTYHSVGSGWANASNTPWRMYKHYNHEGGISSPCIVQWPDGLDRHGIIDKRPGHLIDLMPTILEVAGVDYPDQVGGHKTPPLSGISLLPLLKGETVGKRTFYFEHEGNRAINDGQWKLTAMRGKGWELYNIAKDRTELVDLAKTYPDIVMRMDSLWNIWAEENFVTPLPKDLKAPFLKRVN
jgi:arylsulfatase A-like enzyme